jgi:O-succinylbenzoic acid--CoA ligase
VAHCLGKLAAVPDLVAIDVPAGPAFVAALQSVWERGDAALPVDRRLAPAAAAAVLDALTPAAVLTPDGLARRPGGRPVEAGDALVMATSGTTGVPKGVVLTHAAVEASARATTARLGVDPSRHRWLACLPLNHVGGLSVVMRAVVTGTPLTVLPGFDADRVREASGPAVFVSLVATALLRTPASLFHTVVLGGSAPPAEVAPNVVTTYGLTETGSGVVYDGRPLDGVEIEIDPATSEVAVRGPMLFRAYRDGAPGSGPDGWFRTGDSGWFSPDGRLHVRGRIAEMIISGGENIWPAPVEEALRAHPGVAEAAVAGRPDPEWGQRVVAWVVPRDPSSPPSLAALREVVSERLAPYAAPKELVITDALPRTAIGKVRRGQLS